MSEPQSPLRVAFVTGTEPGKWFERHRKALGAAALDTVDSDDPLQLVLDGAADVALARIPDARISDDFHVVRLYEEAPGVAVPKDSVFAQVGEDVQLDDLADEIINYRIGADGEVDVEAVRAALQIVAANVGVAIAPRPLLKVLSKKQVVPLELADVPADIARTIIALVWFKSADRDQIQDFVGTCRGRSPRSSRNESAAAKQRGAARGKRPQKRRRK